LEVLRSLEERFIISLVVQKPNQSGLKAQQPLNKPFTLSSN